MHTRKSWTIKKAERQRIYAFELCWRGFLRVPWTARRSNQSLLKEINPEHTLEGLLLKMKLQHFGHLMQRTDSLEKTLRLGKTEGKWRKGQQRMRWLESITDINLTLMDINLSNKWTVDINLSKLWETVEDRGDWQPTGNGVAKSQIQLNNWTTTIAILTPNPQDNFEKY